MLVEVVAVCNNGCDFPSALVTDSKHDINIRPIRLIKATRELYESVDYWDYWGY